MWNLIQSTQFKKDLKRFQNQPEMIKALDEVLTSLTSSGIVPAEYRPHPLKGNWQDYMECHVKGDFLLIYYDKVAGQITLSRLGSHSELFGK